MSCGCACCAVAEYQSTALICGLFTHGQQSDALGWQLQSRSGTCTVLQQCLLMNAHVLHWSGLVAVAWQQHLLWQMHTTYVLLVPFVWCRGRTRVE